MNRVRVLSLLSLAVCIGVFSFGFGRFSFDSAESFKASWGWGLLALAGSFGIISAVSVTLLSFFALQPSTDGSFTVKRNSLYGRIFLSFVGMQNRYSFSLCSAFWKTNALLFIGSYILGMVVLLVVVLFKAGLASILLGLVVIVCVIAALAGMAVAGEYSVRRFREFESRSPRAAHVVQAVPLYVLLTAFAVIIGFALYSIGIVSILMGLAMCGAFAAGVFALYLVYKVVERQFGEEFSSFYHQNLCPRIKVR